MLKAKIVSMEFQGNFRLKYSEKYASWYHGNVSMIYLAVSDTIIFQNDSVSQKGIALPFHGRTTSLAYSDKKNEIKREGKKEERKDRGGRKRGSLQVSRRES